MAFLTKPLQPLKKLLGIKEPIRTEFLDVVVPIVNAETYLFLEDEIDFTESLSVASGTPLFSSFPNADSYYLLSYVGGRIDFGGAVSFAGWFIHRDFSSGLDSGLAPASSNTVVGSQFWVSASYQRCYAGFHFPTPFLIRPGDRVGIVSVGNTVPVNTELRYRAREIRS